MELLSPKLFPENESDGDNTSEEFEEVEPNPNHKCLHKAATFPCHGKAVSSAPLPDAEGEEELEIALQRIFCEDTTQSLFSRSASLPTPLKSALKGSRQKQEDSPKKLTVTWAPDVYDPEPNSLSHAVKGKQKKQLKNNDNYRKKNGKKGQKGNVSKGGGSSSSSKKQIRKVGGSSDRCYKSLDARDRLVGPYGGDGGDFDVGSPDSYCGSSFLKKSSNKMHYAVAEAL
ncbi:hypothetical protein CFOL_v3_06213 [Cephalotus follicularis]|uniref:Uncharacterized protein n=1 Tax=Cephalotus follicularis TaxID=3775 RepID=A0A1Q3B402_CEPFO|nr:hypothetical protein CFOL_v3_06213 [Cephalotus follicularis]